MQFLWNVNFTYFGKLFAYIKWKMSKSHWTKFFNSR